VVCQYAVAQDWWTPDEYYRIFSGGSHEQKVQSAREAVSAIVYECYGDKPTPNCTVKKTKKRIYVEAEPYRENRHTSGNWQDFVVDTFILNRVEFEATGKSRRSGRWGGIYYSDPAIYHAERRSTAHRPECFIGLGLPAGATEEEIRAAYRRLARATHPDAGGNAEDFKKIQAWYEQAIMFAGAA